MTASPPGSPPASRLPRARWRDTRVLFGSLLVAASTAVGATVVAEADDTQPVWVASRDLSAGTTLRETDVVTRQVRLGDQAPHYLAAGAESPVGLVLTRPVAHGELVPTAAVADGHAEQRRFVTVPVHRLHLPPGLEHGEQVDVYVTPDPRDGESPRPRLVRPGALVADVVADDRGLGGVQDEIGVVLAVPPPDVPDLVAAVREGAVDLVRVPAEGS